MALTEEERQELGDIVRLVLCDPRWSVMALSRAQAEAAAWAILEAMELQIRNFNSARYAFPRNALRVLEDELQKRMEASKEYIDQSKIDLALVSAAIGEVFRNQPNAEKMLRALLIEEKTLHQWIRDDGIGHDVSDHAHYQRFRKCKERLESQCRPEQRDAVRRMLALRSRNRGPRG